jgi:gamma-glutamyl:cysteine ligase YbdK (ATP-grasp superfamily)
LAAEVRGAEAQIAGAKDDQSRMVAETLLDVLKRLQLKA